MIFQNIINKALDAAKKRQLSKMPLAETDKEDHYEVEVEDAKSWSPETGHKGIESSFYVKSFSYNGKDKELSVQFRDGSTVTYPHIEKSLVEDFVKAPSKGRFVHQHLFDKEYK